VIYNNHIDVITKIADLILLEIYMLDNDDYGIFSHLGVALMLDWHYR
jgi:hypothetical protein